MPLNFPFVINGGGISSMRVGSKESMDVLRPGTTTKGRLFLVTTPGKELIYLDNGLEWVPLNNAFQTDLLEKFQGINYSFSKFKNSLQKEKERAELEESNLATKVTVLTTEINTLTTEANIIIISLNNEITRAQGAEMVLQRHIDEETERAKKAEESIEKEIVQHFTQLDKEKERAMEREDQLQKNIDTEIERAIEAEEVIKSEITNLQMNLDDEKSTSHEAVNELNKQIEYMKKIRQYGYFTSGTSDQQIGKMGQEAVSFNGPLLSSDGIELLPVNNDAIVIRSEGTYRFSFTLGIKIVGPALFGLVDENHSVLYTAGTFGFSSLGITYSQLVGDVILRIPTGGTVIQLKNINDHMTTVIGSVPDINSSTPNAHAATLLIERIH